MKISSAHLQAFVAVAQTKSFSKGASRIHVTQSAISQRVLNLERDLEVTLFIRNPKEVKLTEEGFRLLRYCQTSLALESEFLSSIKSPDQSGKLAGVIRIGGFSSIMRSILIPALADLVKSNPQVRVQFLSREVSELPDLLRRSEIDFMVLNRFEEKANLETLLLGYEKNVLVQSKSLNTHEIYLDHDEEDTTTDQYLRLIKKTDPGHRSYLDEIYSILDAVKLGYGRAVLPKHLIREDSQLQVLSPKTVLRVPVVLHYYKQNDYSHLHLKTVQALKERCGSWL
jgi:DNA-binding transcriptional LysR family regulator